MGFPALIGLALSAVGTGLSMKANADAKSSMEKTARAEMGRQESFRKKAQSQMDTTLGTAGADAANSKIADVADSQEAQYQQLAKMPLSTSAPIVAGNENAVVAARDKGALRLSDRVRAKMAGYGGWQNDQAIRNAESASQLGLLSNMAQRSGAVLPIEMTAAAHSADNLKGIGSLLNTLGSVVGVGGSLIGSGTAQAGTTAAQRAALQAGMGPLSAGSAAANAGAATAMNSTKLGLLNGLISGI